MKAAGISILSALLGSVLVICLLGSGTQCSNDDSVIADYCSRVAASFPDTLPWHLAIYMDIRACLTCCEDMKSWQELESQIPQCGGRVSIWAPRSDSIDVAEAMRLEGLRTPVRVLDEETVRRIQKTKLIPPIMTLFDSTCRPVFVRGALLAAEARKSDQQMLDTICPGR